MPVDLKSAVLKAVENALKQSLAPPQPAPAPEPKKPILSTGKAMLLGAGLATAGGGLISSRGRELVGSIRDRIEERTGDEDEDHEDPAAEDEQDFEDEDYDEPEAEAAEDHEPEAEDDEDFEDEDRDEPEAEDDEDFEDEDRDEPEAEEDDGDGGGAEEEEPEKRPRRGRRAGSAH